MNNNTIKQNLPRHIAIVMDGNGRWAQRYKLPRIMGHRAGIKAVREAVKICLEKQINTLSLFAFSSENWQRPEAEIDSLMDLFLNALSKEVAQLHRNGVQLRFIGDRLRFSSKLQEHMVAAEKLTLGNQSLHLVIAINYGGQWDILQATKKIAERICAGQLTAEQITPEIYRQALSIADLPEPDLFIRTSGEQRISNFFLWQLAYTELYFTEVYWPDFKSEEMLKALTYYAKRQRRFGKTCIQLEEH